MTLRQRERLWVAFLATHFPRTTAHSRPAASSVSSPVMGYRIPRLLPSAGLTTGNSRAGHRYCRLARNFAKPMLQQPAQSFRTRSAKRMSSEAQLARGNVAAPRSLRISRRRLSAGSTCRPFYILGKPRAETGQASGWRWSPSAATSKRPTLTIAFRRREPVREWGPRPARAPDATRRAPGR